MLACLICFKISPGKLKPVNQMFTGFLIFRLDDFNLNQAVKDELLFHSSKGVAVYKVVLFDFKVQRTENIYSHFNTSRFKVQSTAILIIRFNKQENRTVRCTI
jgi:hypothetical protein